MMKIAFVFAAAAVAAVMLTTAPLGTPAKAQELKMAQGVDVQIATIHQVPRAHERPALAASPLQNSGERHGGTKRQSFGQSASPRKHVDHRLCVDVRRSDVDVLRQ
jgi:hypothetical protein